MKLLARLGAFARRHKHAEETLAEAVGINLATRLIAAALAAGAASAAITAVATQTTSPYHPPVALTTKGAAFIARYEGVRLTPYFDGTVACTVGVGHLIHWGGCTPTDYRHWRLTWAQAMTLLAHDSGSAASCVSRSVTRHLTRYQGDSLISLTFNIGCGGLQRSSALQTLNAGDYAAVPARMLAWSYSGGHYLPGLHTRRVAEGTLFSRGYYGPGLGYYTPARPITGQHGCAYYLKLRLPKPVPSWAWRWAEWELGRDHYRDHAGLRRYRPRSAPRPVKPWAYGFLCRIEKRTSGAAVAPATTR